MLYENTSSVTRFTAQFVCPVCGGHDRLPRGEGRRCAGFLSADRQYIHCSREEYAGSLRLHEGSRTYAHRAGGPCRCGVEHAPAALSAPAKPQAPLAPVTARYDYRDEHGVLLFQVERRADKSFDQRRPATPEDCINPKVKTYVDREGTTWATGRAGVRPVLYRWPELLAEPEKAVMIAEGEKDVETLRALGLLATCNAGGGGPKKWLPEYTAALAGRSVVIFADNDKDGRTHALETANQLAIVAASVRMIEFAELPEHGDVSDWLAQPGHDRARLEQLVRETPAWGKQRREAPPRRVVIPTARELLAKVLAEPKMVVDTLFPEGTTLIVGGPKVGKTLLMEHIAISVAQGGFVMGKIRVQQGRVAYLALEDSERLCQKRLQQLLHKQDCPELLHFTNAWRRMDDGGLEDLDAWLAEHRDTRLVVVDTLARVRARDDGKQGVYDRDYQALAPLTDLSHKYNIAIVIVHHTRKMASDDLMDMISGSQALGAAVDAAIVLQRERFGVDGVIGVMGRDIEEAKYAISWDKDLMQWRIEGNAEDFARSKEQNAILAVLKKSGRTLHIQEVADLVGRSANSALRFLLGRLVDSGLVVSPARGEYKAAADAKLATEGSATCEFVSAVSGEYADADDREGGALLASISPGPDDWDDDADDAPAAGPTVKRTTHSTHKLTNSQVSRCAACGFTVSRPAAYNPNEIICARCYVPWPAATPALDDF
jgi:hypothetical protein